MFLGFVVCVCWEAREPKNQTVAMQSANRVGLVLFFLYVCSVSCVVGFGNVHCLAGLALTGSEGEAGGRLGWSHWRGRRLGECERAWPTPPTAPSSCASSSRCPRATCRATRWQRRRPWPPPSPCCPCCESCAGASYCWTPRRLRCYPPGRQTRA